jgi:hypothetical protein
MTSAEFLTSLGTDAQKWAKAFIKQHKELNEEILVGWFANAIMAGYDEGMRKAKENAADKN